MNDDTMQLMFEWHFKFLCILPYPIDTNHNIARDEVGCHMVKSDDVGISVMVEVLPIDPKKVLIVAKEIRDVSHPLLATLDNFGDPFFNFFCLLELEIYILDSKTNSHFLTQHTDY